MSLNWNYTKPSCCAKWLVLPTVYSDALSYGEQLDKFCYQLNELIANNNILPDFISEMIKEYINSGAIGEVVRDILADYILNVKYPPKGIAPAVGDGSADDTAAIQGCIDYAAENGGVVYFPYGSYLTQPLTMKDDVSLFGFDRYSTKIVLKGGATKPLIGGTVADFSIANLTLDGNSGIQVNDVNVATIIGTNVLFTNLIIKDGYTLVNYTGTGGHFQISDVVFGNAVKKCLITTGNADVQCENVVFNQLSAVGGISVMDIGTDGGFFNVKSVATCNQCIIVTGNNNKISAIVKNAATPFVDNGLNNNIEIFGISNKEFYSDDTTKEVGGNYSKHIAGSYTKDVDGNATEIVDGIFSSTIKGASSETFESNRIINENNKSVNNKGVLTETVSGKVTKNYVNDCVETISGKVTKNYGNGYEETVVGNKEITADNYAVNSKSLVVNCEEPMTYKRQVKDLNKYFNSFEVKDINNIVRDVLVFKKDFELPNNIVNVVAMGVDNTGNTDASVKLNELFKNGGSFLLPIGTYLLENQLAIPSNTYIYGEDRDRTVLLASSNMDLVYHTVCTANAVDINARLAVNSDSPKINSGYPSVEIVCSEYVENVLLYNLTVNGNWQNRNLENWNEYYEPSAGVKIKREPGTNIEFQRCRNIEIRRVNSINGPQHNINIRAGAYSYGEGISFVADYPSYNCIICECYTNNQRYDDCITTHDSYNLVIDNCVCEVTNNSNGVYSSAISNGIEIDDGSRYVVVSNCVSSYSNCGYQAKGHTNTPPAHDVVFLNCVAKYNHFGYSISTGTKNNSPSSTTIKDNCSNIYLINCECYYDYAFNNVTDWLNVSHVISLNNAVNVRVKNFVHVPGVPTGLSNVGSEQNTQLRVRGDSTLIHFDGFIITVPLVNELNSYFRFEGKTRNVFFSNVHSAGFSGNPLINYASSNPAGVLSIKDLTCVKKTEQDSFINNVSANVKGNRTEMYWID